MAKVENKCGDKCKQRWHMICVVSLIAALGIIFGSVISISAVSIAAVWPYSITTPTNFSKYAIPVKWNMTEISPNGKVKQISVKKWGKKYDPLRVWCCVPCVLDFMILSIIQQTWGKYCDKLLFFIGDSTQKDIEVINATNGTYTLHNVVKLKLNHTGYKEVYEKIWKMRRFLYVHHKNDYDWMIKIDTDAWFSTPNFKGYAQYFDPNLDWYFGDPEANNWFDYNVVFNAGAAYALSRGAINKLNRIYATEEFINPFPERPLSCQVRRTHYSDVYTGICLKSIGIFPTNSLDTLYRTRWSPFTREQARDEANFIEEKEEWYFWNRFERQNHGKNCCAEHMISFHNYKNKESIFDDFSKLDAMYSEKSKDNWMSHPLPPKPVTFLFNTSINEEIDEWFNEKDPPRKQKLWKGKDNLWNYSTAIEG